VRQLRRLNERTAEPLQRFDGPNSLARECVSKPRSYEDTVLTPSDLRGQAESFARTVEDAFLTGILGPHELPDLARIFYWLGQHDGYRARQVEVMGL
jgi:hypothetical protein